MKKISILFIILMSMIGLTACVNTNANVSDTSNGNKTSIKMELDKDYDDTDSLKNIYSLICQNLF